VGVPVSSRLELVPSAELFYLSPVDADPQSELHPYIGAGVAGEEPGDWDWELGLTYGPRAAGVSSVGASAAVSKGLRFGSDAPGPPPTGPDLRMDLSLNATVFSWRGPLFAGTSVTQVYAESHVRARLPHHLALRGQGMFFLYNPSLALRTAEAIDAFGILARVGTYAPRALGGVRLIWKATGTVAPLIQADEIVYAAGVGTATQVAAGFRLEMAPVLWATLVGGFLHNVLSGVASTLDDARTVPLVDVTVSVAF
jgi:hypothetical protein